MRDRPQNPRRLRADSAGSSALPIPFSVYCGNAAHSPISTAMRIALHQPDIAGNVGTILRLAACLGIATDIIEPCGFAFSERALRRAGMDYADAAEIVRHADWAAFEAAATGRIVLLSTRADVTLDKARFAPGDILLLGSEGAGVPETVHDRADLRVRIPMRPGFRSLNVAVSAGIALGEALRQTKGWPE
jgi:tRNA (cytidine/uridine-2'-O-)-methyltransferase